MKSKTETFFYKNAVLTTKISPQETLNYFRSRESAMAVQSVKKTGPCLLATNMSNSALQEYEKDFSVVRLYSPYGFEFTSNRPAIGFNGEVPHLLTLNYGLGLGYRIYNPASMRFQSPDDWSPFGRGGINAYAYCFGDPVNRTDPSGHSGMFTRLLKGLGNRLGLRKGSSQLPAKVRLLQVRPTAFVSGTDINSETPALPNILRPRSNTYASIGSYQSILDDSPALPVYSPPGSANDQSFANNFNRTAHGRNDSDIQNWIDASFSEQNPDNSFETSKLFIPKALNTINVGAEWSKKLVRGIRSPTLMKIGSKGNVVVLR